MPVFKEKCAGPWTESVRSMGWVRSAGCKLYATGLCY